VIGPQSATASTTIEARVSAARHRLVAAGIDEREVALDADRPAGRAAMPP